LGSGGESFLSAVAEGLTSTSSAACTTACTSGAEDSIASIPTDNQPREDEAAIVPAQGLAGAASEGNRASLAMLAVALLNLSPTDRVKLAAMLLRQ